MTCGCRSSAAVRRKKAATQLRAKVDISEMRAADKEWPKPCIFRADDEGRADQAGRAISRPLRKASEQGGRLSQAELIGGIVTAPLNKAGYHYPGLYRDAGRATSVKGSVMMLAYDNMRVTHVFRTCRNG